MTEGEGLNVDQFLKDNDLSYLKDSFVEKQVSLEELADFSNTELTAFAKDLELDEEQTSRFIAAIRKLKPVKSTSTTVAGEPTTSSSKSGGGGDLVHLIISPQEHEAITKLHERYDKTILLLKQLEASFDTLIKNGEVCQQDINAKMELVYKQIYEWQNKLCDAVDSMKDSKKQRLQQQLDQLKTYRAEINQGKKKYQELIDDPTLDVQYRKKQVVGMVDELLGRSDIPLLMVTQPKMEFGWNEQFLNTLVSHIIINDCDQPFPPHVMVTVVRYNSAVLQISIVSGELGREVLEFAVEYAVLPKDEDNKLKLEYSPLDDASSFRTPSIASEHSRHSQASSVMQKKVSTRLSVAKSQANVMKAKKKSKKKSDDSDSDESKSDKSSEDEDEDKSSKSESESESESESDKDSENSEKSDSEKSSNDSDEDESDTSSGKKKKKKDKKKRKEQRKRK